MFTKLSGQHFGCLLLLISFVQTIALYDALYELSFLFATMIINVYAVDTIPLINTLFNSPL